MAYTVQKLAKLAGVSVRTLHHYDAIGLLAPSRMEKNGYRQYGESELLRLQQILFFRELDFPLGEIKRILASPHFDMRMALEDHRALIELKKKRLSGLLKTIDKTIEKLEKQHTMNDDELYTEFSKEEEEAYAREAKERWGHTIAWKQSQERYGKMTSAQKKQVGEAGGALLAEIVAAMGEDPKSPQVQVLIARHYEGLRTFYDPNVEMYRGLAEMYIADPRFTAYYEKRKEGLAQFMHDAMIAYCDNEGIK